MGKTSLISQLTDLRRLYTGENEREATHAARVAVSQLSSGERATVADWLRNRQDGLIDCLEVRHLGNIGSRLMPAAGNPLQETLEALVLRAAASENDVLRMRPPASLLRPARPIRGVEARAARLVVHLDPYGLGPLLMGLLPRRGDHEVHGVPGLRHRQFRRSVELFLLDEGEQASVTLADVDAKGWKAAVDFAGDCIEGFGAADRRLWSGRTRRTLSDEEREQLLSLKRLTGPASLGSALLRRIGLFRDAQRITTRGEDRQWILEWSDGPSVDDIAGQLANPLFGLPATFALTSVNTSSAVFDEQVGSGLPRPGRTLTVRREWAYSVLDNEQYREANNTAWPTWPTWLAWTQKRNADSVRFTEAASQVRDQVAARRAAFTGETVSSATKGIADDRAGLDTCDAAQRTFRSLLAIHVFNTGPGSAVPSDRSAHAFTRYTMTISPRYDDLVIFADAPDNVTGRLIETRATGGIPGLRVRSRPNGGTFNLLHLPTGATMTITSRPEHRMEDDEGDWPTGRWLTTETPLRESESDHLRLLPHTSAEMQVLLAGLFVRMNCQHPNGTWAVGNWHSDPLSREPRLPWPLETECRLWGARDAWEARWNRYPFASDVANALTDPEIGIPGITVIDDDPSFDLALGDASLRLRIWPTRTARQQVPYRRRLASL